MIDKRLLKLNSWISEEQDQVNHGRQGTSEPWGAAVRAALAEFFQNLLAQMPKAPANEGIISSVVQQFLPTAIEPPADFADQWPATIIDDINVSLLNPSDHGRPIADWFIASALFDALVSRKQPSVDGVHVARMLAENSTRVLAFSEIVGASSIVELGVVTAAMRTFIQDECSRPESHLLPSRRSALGPAMEVWAAEADFGAVWDTRVWMGLDMLPERLGMLAPLAAARPIELLPLIEEIRPFPLQEGCFYWRSITYDLDKVLEMLERAPLVIDEQSGLWNRNVVAPLLLQTAFGVIRELGIHRKNDGTPLAHSTELANIAHTIIERALMRPDGVQLVSRWMRHQVHVAASRSEDSIFEAVFNATLAAFAQSKVDAADVYPSMSEEPPEHGVFPSQLADDDASNAYEQLVLAAMLVQERVLKGEGRREASFRPSFIALLRKARSPFSVRYGEVMPTWRHRVFAKIYMAEDEVAESWREDFDLFAPEQRAALHYSYFDDNSLMAPSLFLAGVGLSLIDCCLEADEKSPLSCQGIVVWRAVFEATQLLFTHWSLSNDVWRNVAASLFARYPGCLRALNPADLSKEQPAQLLSRLGGDEGLVANALANLLNNGMDAAIICGSGPEVTEMKLRMQNYLAWEGEAGSRALNRGVRSYLVKNFVGREGASN
ncbi:MULTISPECIES: hypothetical protein [unclassified Herbaspirillum]|uniref:hypothetical protein n=1 Tax=unclassified Herbaspirillum TaxID=2624150 RepID=UPI000E2EEBC9|nr:MULTISPECIES: hypothetical protein [unclassified Herbaspirillum]RFB68600.1 hypothetical protein DZB54_15770 [Herbaspirillum sp. 3R-3a1]TFI05506.1 hypothetical protein E4P32_20445 [Herbaspirillum sp. 3R11]TFI13584.1 hypothetical protein E4P31_18150 [Herbaspirillum sp. 3R-11]TFI27110.1 hypothetical protein E4P30_10520 [Herbaspirillum sp. 3C11]